MIKIAIMSYGITGSGVAEVLEQNRDVIAKQAGQEVGLKYVLDLREFPNNSVAGRIVHDSRVIEQNEEISIMVETMGDLNPAYPFAKACLLTGKHVATSNKVLVAAYGTELLAVARERGMNFLFKVNVDGGIPIIRPLYRYLIRGRIKETTGTPNGTTNFILARMDKEDESSESALKGMQNLGHAERNPEADVEGRDACRKIAILTATATGRETNFEDIYTGGIIRVADVNSKCAEKIGTSVKFFGSSRMAGGKVNAFVAPMMIQEDNPLYSANDVLNRIMVRGNMLRASMFYGSGAGKLSTANAAVTDIIEATQNPERSLAMSWSSEKQTIESIDLVRSRCFVRAVGSYHNKEEGIKYIFGKVGVVKLYGMDEFVVLTTEMSEGGLKAATVVYDGTKQARSDYGIKQVIRAMI